MATSRKMNLGKTKKVKSVKGVGVVSDLFIPKTPADAALYAVPYGKAARAVGGIAKKGARFVGKTYRNMGR